jgi:hypothetical protein
MSDQGDITQRMDGGEAVTQRMDRGGVTARMGTDAGLVAGGALSVGEVVGGRYRVVDGPLGARTGEADVYRCEDAETGDVVAVKHYRSGVQPKGEVLDKLRGLRHEDIVQLRHVDQWQGRFYEVMEFCAGGTLADLGRALQEDELRRLLREAVSGLQYLHTSGIVHRDIKPTNLFFRDKGRRDLVIGDFGISSVVGVGIKRTTTATIGRMTFEYAAPEQLGDKKFGPKTDYYSLGITLLFALHGRSPFDGMDEYKIIELKARSELPVPSGCSPEFRRLLRGLTRRNMQYRWGYVQVQAWLDGKAVTTDEGLPDSDSLDYADRVEPYPACRDITNPREMAASLEKFRAEYELFHGFISKWVHLHFDAKLADRIVEVEENYTKDPKLGVFKLRYLLDPGQPLDVGGQRVGSLMELGSLIEAVLQKGDLARLAVCEELMYERKLESWIDAALPGDNGAKAAKAAAELRTKHKSRRLGLMAFFYTLNPQAPLYLGPGAGLKSPSDLEAVLKAQPGARSGFGKLLFDGVIGEWLRIAFPNRIEDARFVRTCAEAFKEKRELGIESVRWRFDTRLPFAWDGVVAKDQEELARVIGRNEASFRQGMRLLEEGWIRGWLVATGRLVRSDDLKSFDEMVGGRASWGAKMQLVLGMLSKGAVKPIPVAQPAVLSLGRVAVSGSRRTKVTVRNGGGGFLSGTVAVGQQGAACKLDGQTTIEGGAVEFTVVVSPVGEPAGARRKLKVRVITNGGTIEIPVTYTVGAPWAAMLGRSAGIGLAWAAFLGGVRFLFELAFPDFHAKRLDWMGIDQLIPNSPDLKTGFAFLDQYVTVIFLGSLIVGAAYGWCYYLRRLQGKQTVTPLSVWRHMRRRR